MLKWCQSWLSYFLFNWSRYSRIINDKARIYCKARNNNQKSANLKTQLRIIKESECKDAISRIKKQMHRKTITTFGYISKLFCFEQNETPTRWCYNYTNLVRKFDYRPFVFDWDHIHLCSSEGNFLKLS